MGDAHHTRHDYKQRPMAVCHLSELGDRSSWGIQRWREKHSQAWLLVSVFSYFQLYIPLLDVIIILNAIHCTL